MAEQQLDGTNVGALFQEVDGKSVSKRMRRDRFRDLANTVGLLALLLNRKSCDVPAREVSWEEPVLGFSTRHQARRISRSFGESRVYLSFFPLPCSTRKTMRLLSIAGGLSATASEMRRPAA